jgi:hypothetical protein
LWGFQHKIQLALGFQNITGTDTGCTDFHFSDSGSTTDSDALKVGFEDTLVIFDYMHTNTAGFFRKTFSDDTAANNLSFTADLTFTHFKILQK